MLMSSVYPVRMSSVMFVLFVVLVVDATIEWRHSIGLVTILYVRLICRREDF